MSLDFLDVKVKFIRGFADRTRLQILSCIFDSEKTVSQIVDEIQGNQSNISQHLGCLKGCGIVESRQEGKYVFYSMKNEQMKQLLTMFDSALSHVEDRVACCETNDKLLADSKGGLS
ncbi:metalloregulator ArsR/SmtB family transcription factor [Paenibacillus sp. GYB004]|uniref:ArsR/SmtB family transcription factor n=1 Tax=Paenibacillus sp. GYB004 TaxID=2994393 RepID=UPI002F96CA11